MSSAYLSGRYACCPSDPDAPKACGVSAYARPPPLAHLIFVAPDRLNGTRPVTKPLVSLDRGWQIALIPVDVTTSASQLTAWWSQLAATRPNGFCPSGKPAFSASVVVSVGQPPVDRLCDARPVIQVDRQLQSLPVVQEAGGRERRRPERGLCVIGRTVAFLLLPTCIDRIAIAGKVHYHRTPHSVRHRTDSSRGCE